MTPVHLPMAFLSVWQAFATLSQCGSGVVHRLLLTVEAALLLFPARTGFPDDIFRRLDGECT